MRKTKGANNSFLNSMKHYSYIKNGLHDINRPKIYLRDVQGLYTKKFIDGFETAISFFMNCYKIIQ